ncbi:MAG: substrate-binding domain-containing protein [Oscillospiraceae bacterium]|nr:substrate-binding domain-containing protein [Oscillospiraceae bacterium]
MRKSIALILLFGLFALTFLLAGCSDDSPSGSGHIVMATTLDDAELLDALLSAFTEETGFEVDVIFTSNVLAFELARNEEVDLLFTNSQLLEDQFVQSGFAENSSPVMRNDFILIGPHDGNIFPNNDILDTMYQVLSSNLPFLSRGDGSTTHLMELLLWSGFYLNQWNNPFYFESLAGMNATIGLAVSFHSYTITDTASWLAFPEQDALVVITDNDFRLMNQFSAIAVSASDMFDGANSFVNWVVGDSAQEIIENYGLEEFGTSLFIPVGTEN